MAGVVIHANPALAHQVEFANYLAEGFAAHGLAPRVTAWPEEPGPLHVIQGPWHAYKHALKALAAGDGRQVLFLDRCFYGDAARVVSLGWLRADGSRDFRLDGVVAGKGLLPELKAPKEGRRSAVVFADYGQDVTEWVRQARQEYSSVFYRRHPRGSAPAPALELTGELAGVWALCDVAIGGTSTVLVEAALNGLHVVTHDRRHVCANMGDRAAWLRGLSWAQWGADEIRRGAFWDHLGRNYADCSE